MGYGFCLFLLIVGLAIVGLGLGLQNIPVTEQRRRLGAVVGNFPSDTRIVFTATTASSTTLSVVSSFAGLQVGMTLSGTGVGTGAQIVAMDSGAGTITVSVTGTGAHVGSTITATFVATSAEVHLYMAPFSGGDDPTPADFTEADFDTYAAITLPAAIGPYTNPDGSAEIDYGDVSWVLIATPTVGNTIYGYWIDYVYPVGGATRVVAAWEDFPTPLPMTANGNAIVASIPIKLPEPGSVSLP